MRALKFDPDTITVDQLMRPDVHLEEIEDQSSSSLALLAGLSGPEGPGMLAGEEK